MFNRLFLIVMILKAKISIEKTLDYFFQSISVN